MNDVPAPDKKKRHEELQAAIVKAMSPEARKLYKNCPEALRTYHVGDVCYDGCNWSTRNAIVGDVPNATVDELAQKYKDEDKKVSDARRSLQGAIEACSTYKQLMTRLPEFEKYYPKPDAPTANLPALANVVADLSKLGWPKGITSTTTSTN
jgi:phosphoglycolate phosphatase-like HAD superfamily hydrolase